jgi:ATP-binding cassette subfamily B protein
MGGGGRMGLRSLSRDRKILEHQIKKGTLPRILRFARHYRPALIFFLTVVVLGRHYLLGVALDYFASDYRRRHLLSITRRPRCRTCPPLTAALAIGDAGLQMIERRISAIIGEGLIYDLRVEVFRHIQEMPIAFFSREPRPARSSVD